MFESLTVADGFLELSRERHRALTPMQLLKLVYIAHGWRLGLYGKPLIRDEIQAWQYGSYYSSLIPCCAKLSKQSRRRDFVILAFAGQSQQKLD